jgi:hypothetical protein
MNGRGAFSIAGRLAVMTMLLALICLVAAIAGMTIAFGLDLLIGPR